MLSDTFDSPRTHSEAVFKSAFAGFWAEYKYIISVLIGFRVALFAMSYAGLSFFPVNAGDSIWRGLQHNAIFDGFTRWDAGWYRDIAEKGYTNLPQPVSGQRDTAFWPGYPFIVHLARPLTGGNTLLAGILVSNVCFLAAGILLFAWCRKLFDRQVAERSVVLWMLFPFAFFMSAVYAESLFIASVLAAFLAGEHRRWWLAGACAIVAGTTRAVGFLVVPALVILYMEQIRFDWRRVRWNFGGTLLGCLGPLSVMAYMGWRFGNPLVFQESERAIGWMEAQELIDVVHTIRACLNWELFLAGRIPLIKLLPIVCLPLALLMVGMTWRRFSWAYRFWTLASIAIGFTAWHGFGRYCSVIFPLAVAPVLLLRQRPHLGILGYTYACMQTILLQVFTHFYWVA